MPKKDTSQLSLIPDEEDTVLDSYLLVPFAAANLARVLAGCFLTGTATGFNRSDAQAHSDTILVAFEHEVPKIAIAQCAVESGVPVILQLDNTGLDIVSGPNCKLVRCPISTANVRRISFASEKGLEETSARISRFKDVPWSNFEFDVNPAVFSDRDVDKQEALADLISSTERGSKDDISRAMRVGGVLASQIALMRTSNAFDSWILNIYKKAIAPGELSSVIYDTVIDDLKSGPGDRVAWALCWDYVAARDSADGFSSSDFLEHVRSKAGDLPADEEKQIKEWIDFCDGVISARREFPRHWQDSDNPALRAVLIFMLSHSRDKLRAFMDEHEVGNRIAMFTQSLAGQLETIKRIPANEKSPSRQQLDLLSSMLVDIYRSNPIELSVSEPVLGPDGKLQAEILFGGEVLVSRRQAVAQPYLEIFAKAQRLEMTQGFDSEIDCFYIERQDIDAKETEALRIYVSIENTKDRRSLKRARFFMPVNSFSTNRAPAAKLLRSSLEDAWKHQLGIGIFEQGQRHVLAYFWTQMVDTFDAIEFSDMVARFESALSR